MDSYSIVSIVFAVLIFVALTWLAWAGSTRVNTFEQLQRAIELAPIAVAGAEQLYNTGELDADMRLGWAIGFLRPYAPALDEKRLRGVVEGAVYAAKEGAALVGLTLPEYLDLDGDGDFEGFDPGAILQRFAGVAMDDTKAGDIVFVNTSGLVGSYGFAVGNSLTLDPDVGAPFEPEAVPAPLTTNTY